MNFQDIKLKEKHFEIRSINYLKDYKIGVKVMWRNFEIKGVFQNSNCIEIYPNFEIRQKL